MFKNVKHNNVRSLNLKLRNDKYYDFMLYRGECVTVGNSDGCVVADIKPYNMSKGKVYSEREWEEAVNNGVALKNIGFTGMDNGIITFRRDKITNTQFLKLYTESEYNIEKGDKRFFMFPVTGNSNQYKYFYSLEDDGKGGFITLNGGFLQGFYKLFGEEYQTLPNHIENDMNFEFVLRRKDYDVHYRTINHTHPDNNGIFFYMGTRAENKFWLEYKRKANVEDLLDTENHHGGYFEDYIPSLDNVIETDYFLKDIEKLELNLDSGYNSRCNCNADYITNGYSCDLYFASNEKGGCVIDGHWSRAQSGANYERFDLNLGDGWKSQSTKTLKYALQLYDWDIITMQQGSPVSGDPSSLGNLQNLIDYVNATKTNPNAKLYWHMTWAYSQFTAHSGFANYNNDQLTMYNAIVNTTKDCILTNSGFAGVIPAGTAIQNYRGNDTNNKIIENGYITVSDGYHLKNYSEVLAAMTWLRTLTGLSLNGIKCNSSDVSFASAEVRALRRSAENAYLNPFEIHSAY